MRRARGKPLHLCMGYFTEEKVVIMEHKVAISLTPLNTDDCLAQLYKWSAQVKLAEVCLDKMHDCDLPRLIHASPCPLIITCRPIREGGQFVGAESERWQLLLKAMELNCAYVDLEWDSIDLLSMRPYTNTKVIVSRHWYDSMPTSLLPIYNELRFQADIVKLVGMANRASDIFPVFDLLHNADSPVIGLAMGTYGIIARIFAPYFAHCFLTYAAPSSQIINAPGQLSVSDMLDFYHHNGTTPPSELCLILYTYEEEMKTIFKRGFQGAVNETLYIPWHISVFDRQDTIKHFKYYFKNVSVCLYNDWQTNYYPS